MLDYSILGFGIIITIFIGGQCSVECNSNHGDNQKNYFAPGPAVKQTHGKIWPKPQMQTEESEVFFTLNPNNFSFKVKLIKTCDYIV